MASASMDAVIRAEHRSPTDPRSPGPKPSHPGRVLLRFEENPGFDVGESRFGCRSTALGAKGSQTRTPSHPARVLLRFEKNPGFDAGESRSRCRSTALGAKGSRARAPSHPGRVLLRFEENPGVDLRESRCGCRSTALGAKGSQARAPSHPPRVLLRFEKNPGFDAGESRSRCRYSVKGQAFMCSSLNNCEESKAVSSLMHAHIPVRYFLITAHLACIFFLPRDTSAS